MLNYDEFLELVKKRRSIHRFRPEPIPDGYVEKIIDAARFAPSGANIQPWEFLVVKERATIKKIAELYQESSSFSRRMEKAREEARRHPVAYRPEGEEPGFAEAPVLIILLGDPRTKEGYLLSALYGHAEKNFDSDLANAFLYMHLAARSLGLGSHWITSTSHPFMRATLNSLLNIPEEMIIYDTMALGFPAYEPKSRIVRDFQEIIHQDRYDRSKYRTDEEVRNFISSIHTARR